MREQKHVPSFFLKNLFYAFTQSLLVNIMNSADVMTGGGHVEMETNEEFFQKNSRAYFGRRGNRHCSRYSAFTSMVHFPGILFNLVRLEFIPVGYMLNDHITILRGGKE